MTIPFVNPDGFYAGGFEKGENPQGTVAVSSFPKNANQIWDFENETWGAVPVTVEMVKAEAERRIVAVYPIFKQINIEADHGIESSEYTTMRTFIDAIRIASNALEETLPLDYRSDTHWPSEPS